MSNLTRKTRFIRRSLLLWYDAAKRDLPWRRDTHDPYRIWVSEIMLQQTRVEVVMPYYRRFLRRFPTVKALARAPESEVMSLWSGLGYYRRARMLHQAAQTVVADHSGRLPDTAESLLRLSGIGRYTASAIASICFNECTAVVDGNVERVLQRLNGRVLPKKEQWGLANALIPKIRAGDFNQAMMELGATICTPVAPRCGTCPLKQHCIQKGRLLSTTAKPTKIKRTIRLALDFRADRVKLVQRSAAESVMPLMWELPPSSSKTGSVEHRLKHSITKTDYSVIVRRERTGVGKYIPISAALKRPLTGLTRKILRVSQLD